MPMLRTISCTVLLALPIALVLATPSAAQTQYLPTEVGTLGGGNSQAYAISNYGQIVGRSDDLDEATHAFHWQDYGLLDLNVEIWNRRNMQLDYAVAFDVSNTDHVVGTTQCTPDNQYNPPPDAVGSDVPGGAHLHAFIYRPLAASDATGPYPGDPLVYLGTLGNADNLESAATGISPGGEYVVGWSDIDHNGQVHAFMVTPVGGVWASTDVICGNPHNPLLQDLGTLAAADESSGATAVNDSGQVVGWSYAAAYGYAAFIWENGVMVSLGTLGGTNSWARDINDAGQIVGEADTSDWLTQPFLWQPSTATMSSLGTLGGRDGGASAINNLGQIVGWSMNANNQRRAFIINPVDTDDDSVPDQWFVDDDGDGLNDLMSDLNDLLPSGFGVRLTEARDINDNGEIVGWGTVGAEGEEQYRAFLLTPTTLAASGGGSTSGTSGITGGSHTDATLEPVAAGDADSDGTTDSETTSSLTALGPFHFLCGVGFAELLPFLLVGLCGVKLANRRRVA